jgi:hypothetical protein
MKSAFPTPHKLWATISMGIFVFLTIDSWILASYKIILKDGKVIEAKSKPVSMEGHFRFSGVDGNFQSLPVGLIDLRATEAANQSNRNHPPTHRVFTNEDLSSKDKNPNGVESLPLLNQGKPSTPIRKTETGSKDKDRGETYWKNRAKQIREQMAAIDSEIKKIDEKIKSGKGDGIEIGLGTYNQYMLVGFEDQRRNLQTEKEKLEKQMTALEDEARKVGALPGWLR